MLTDGMRDIEEQRALYHHRDRRVVEVIRQLRHVRAKE
jgi:hypothetical protein